MKKIKLPKLPNGTKISFMYRSSEYLNIVEVKKDRITFFLWNEESEYPSEIINFDRIK